MTVPDGAMQVIQVLKEESNRIIQSAERTAQQEININKVLIERLERDIMTKHEVTLLRQDAMGREIIEALDTATMKSSEAKDRATYALNEAMVRVAGDLRESTVQIATTLRDSNVLVAATLAKSSGKISFLTQLLITISFMNFVAICTFTYFLSR